MVEETLLPDVAHMMILILTINVAHLCSFQITKRPNVFGNYEKIDEWKKLNKYAFYS